MYASYFGLRDNPFSITPDPSYLYLSVHHQEALAHLLYGTGEHGGFVQLTGEVGTGKTTLIRTLLAQHIENLDIALCLNPRLTVIEFVASVCDELHVEYPRDSATLKPLVDRLNEHLLAAHARGRRTVLIIDEAQNLSHDVLEQIRLLTNLETHRHKLLRIILAGQPELQHMLARQDMRQLAQRITARYHLMPLDRKETVAYIVHRLKVAGSNSNLFTQGALKTAYQISQGVPRLINIVCDRALLGAYVRGLTRVETSTVRCAAREALQGPKPRQRGRPQLWLASAAALFCVIASAAVMHMLPFAPILPQFQDAPLTETLEPPATAVQSAAGPATLASLAPDPTEKETPISMVEAHDDSSHELTELAAIETLPKLIPAAIPAKPEPIEELKNWLSVTVPPDDAMQRLLSIWGEDSHVSLNASLCESIKAYGLRCLHGRGYWDELRLFNRPVILHLTAAGPTHQVLMRSLDVETATVDIAESPLQIALAELERLWNGEYLLFWRPQTPYELIGPRSWGKPVEWLRARLALSEGPLPAGPLSTRFDRALEERVRRFQGTHNLEADGIVGERTMLLLNNLAPAPDTPMLISSSKYKAP